MKKALQRIEREERYKERSLKREGRTYLSPRTAPPPPSSPTRIAFSGQVVKLTQSPQSEITGNIETSSTLESEENKVLRNSSNLFSQTPVIEDIVESSLSSQRSQIPDKYLFSKPQAINFDQTSTSYEPELEYLKETWIQQNSNIHEQVINSFEGSPSNLEDPENLPYLETSPNPFALDSDSDQVVTPYTLEDSNSETTSVNSENSKGGRVIKPPNMAQRPLNLVHLPQYFGQAGTDPDAHVSMFNVVCAANLIPEAQFLVTFPATLYGAAQEWYQTHRPFATWDALRDAFLTRFRPLAFTESLQERLRTIRMAVGESVDNYYG